MHIELKSDYVEFYYTIRKNINASMIMDQPKSYHVFFFSPVLINLYAA